MVDFGTGPLNKKYELNQFLEDHALVEKIVGVAAGNLPVKEIAIAADPKELLIVLDDSVTR